MFPKQKTVIIIVGPTAVGKTAVAIELAKHFHTEIISADSRQCYKELKIGVARPSEKELQQVPHHFIASHSIQHEITAAEFEKYALDKVQQLFKKHDLVVMVGGTGLYVRAFCEGLDAIPAIDPGIRNEIIQGYEEKGLAWLQQEIKQQDPGFYEVGEIQNPQRLMRALEVKRSTGNSILDFRKGKKTERDFNIIKIGLQLPKEVLHERINARVDKMMEQGLLDEVKNLLAYKDLNALQTVGYKELFDYLIPRARVTPGGEQFHAEGPGISLEDAIELIKQNTRQYAKRQMTWFRKDKEVNWFEPGEVEKIIGFVREWGIGNRE